MSPRLNTAKPTTTRERLLHAAHSLIWANSYAHVSVEDICRAAGVQKGSFYHFFPTKADLAAAALEDHWAQACPVLDDIFDSKKTPQQQLRALCVAILEDQQASLDQNGKVCGCPYATLSSEMGGQNDALYTLSRKISAKFLGYYERLLRNAVAEGLIPATKLKERAAEMQVYVLGAMFHARMTNTLDGVGKPMERALMRIAGFADEKAKPKARTSRQKATA